MYVPNDAYSRRATEEGFRARSVYKLEELDKRFHLFRSGMKIIDLGAAPGSWLQYISKRVGPKGKVIGIDLQAIEPIADNVFTAVEDITNIESVQRIISEQNLSSIHCVVSDLAPSTSGIKDIDQWRSVELSEAVLETAMAVLPAQGKCVIKVLRGADFDEFLQNARIKWELIRATRVKASRNSSREVYVVLKKK